MRTGRLPACEAPIAIDEHLHRAQIGPGRHVDELCDDRLALGDLSRVSVAADDNVTPAYFSEALAKAIPGAKLKVFSQGGHLLYHVIEREYTQAMLDFLKGD